MVAEETIDKIKAGKDEYFREVIHEYQQQIFKYNYFMLGKFEDAENATQVDNNGFFLVEQGKEIFQNLKIKQVVANFGKGTLDYIKVVVSGVMEFLLQLFK